MKKNFLLPLLSGLGLMLVVFLEEYHHAGQQEAQRKAWDDEKTMLMSSRDHSGPGRDRSPRTSTAPSRVGPDPANAKPTAQSLLNQLASLPVREGDARSIRPVLVLLEQLSRIGPKALPAVREFLASDKDLVYTTSGGKRLRDIKFMVNALVPFSLRLGLFDIVAQAGGSEAEAILAENLGTARSGVEVAYLAEVLEQLAPGSYRAATTSAAIHLLEKGVAADRNILFEIMRSLGDTSYVASAQNEMIKRDGQIDRDALRYLQQALGPQSLNLAARSYQDPHLVEAGSKEPLARVALSYVGTDARALDLFHTALLDPSLLPDQKRNLVEDLNEDGLANRRTPTPEDLQIITRRYELTQAYLQQEYVRNDNILNAAFLEADKDLRKMLERAAANSPP